MAKARRLFHHKWRWQRVTKLMARDGEKCTICDEPLSRKVKDPYDKQYITFDHIVPRSHGGNDLLPNLRLAHQVCNMKRGNDPILPYDEDKTLARGGLEHDAEPLSDAGQVGGESRLDQHGDAGAEPAHVRTSGE